MKSCTKFLIVSGATAGLMIASVANAQYYGQPLTGAGSTVQPSQQWQQQQRQWQQPSYVDPTSTWQYRAAQRALPIVGGIRDCSFGALAGSIRGAVGMATGCAGGITPYLSPWRPHNAY